MSSSQYHYACGTGPFLLKEFRVRQRVVLEKEPRLLRLSMSAILTQ